MPTRRSDVRWVIGLILINWITVVLAIYNKYP
jgi:hypothetical protein